MLNSRSASIVPFAFFLVVMPFAIGAFGLWLDAMGNDQPAYWTMLMAMGLAGLCMLGLILTGERLRAGFATRRALRRLHRNLAAATGDAGADIVWATDPEGHVLWQSPTAEARFCDRIGSPISGALARFIADPDGETRRMIGRASLSGVAAQTTPEGRLELRIIDNGALHIWSLKDLNPVQPTVMPREIEGFDALPVALLGLDSTGRVTRSNAAARILLPGVTSGLPFMSLLDGLGRSIEDWLDDVLHRRVAPAPEMLRRRGDGPECFVQVTLAGDGADGLIAVLSDASALKTLEAQFVQSQKMQAIGQLAGGIAHDFNNLLTAIGGHCDLLMLRRDETDPDYADIQQISQNANRAASLVGQLLAFSRKQTMKPEIIDPRDTLSELTHLLRRLVSERITLSFHHDPALRPIKTDPRQLDQVIMNLVVNARDAMPKGGGIAIRTANITLKEGLSRDRVLVPSGEYVLISVADEGCGIPPDKIGKAFEPFYTTKRVGEGTGLGLATVYGIIKQSGGYVFCDSELGRGTTFSIYLPAHTLTELMPAQSKQNGVSSKINPPERQVSVLVVEDEAAVRAFAVRALRLNGFEVVEAENAEAALDLLDRTDRVFDVFVTDVVMPGMDGSSWVRIALRKQPNAKVIFMSGYSEDIFHKGRLPIESAQFLQKPFTLQQLTELVREQAALL